MTNTIVIAELNKGNIHSTTKELVSAAQMLGSSCTVVVPCTDSSVVDSISSTSGIEKVIVAKSDIFANYDASGWASAIDSVAPEGIIIASGNDACVALAEGIAGSEENFAEMMNEKAIEMGAYCFKSIEAVDLFYEKIIKYLVFGNVLRNNTYPLSVSSERIIQAIEIVEYAIKNIQMQTLRTGRAESAF